MKQTMIKDLVGSVSISNGVGGVIWTYQLPMRMAGLLLTYGNGTDTIGAVNGTTYWQLQRNGAGVAPYDLVKDLIGSYILPVPAESVQFMGGDVITAYAFNGYTASAKFGIHTGLQLVEI